MNAFLASSIHSETPHQEFRRTITDWIKRRIERRQRLQRERQAVEHLRKLEPYLLRDAGIDSQALNAALARITPAQHS